MYVERVFCPTCQHPVKVTTTEDHHDAHATLPDGHQLVCLDFAEGCCEGPCPLSGTAGIVMGVRLARSHLRDETFRLATVWCEGCQEAREMEVLDAHYAFCPVCGSTNRMVTLEGEGDGTISPSLA